MAKAQPLGEMMEDICVHIGYPKCASTALQRYYFSVHPELFHIGANGGGMVAPYLNEDVRLAVEVELRLAKDFVYNDLWVRDVFSAAYNKFHQSGRRYMSLSSESLSFTMHHDIDITQKASRLFNLFDKGTRIIIIMRNQMDLLRSMYREYIISGLSLTYGEFVEAMVYNRFRSLIEDFNFHTMYSLYQQLFGQENVLMLPYEHLREKPKETLDRISNFMGIATLNHGLPYENNSHNDIFYESLRRINQYTRHDMGRSVIEPVNQFRYTEYFTKHMKLPIPYAALHDAKVLDMLFAQAYQQIAQGFSTPIDYTIRKDIAAYLHQNYATGNAALAKEMGVSLGIYGYPL